MDVGNVAEVAYGKGVTKVEQVGVPSTVGELDVSFDRDLRGCIVQVTPGVGRPRGATISALDAKAGVFIDPADAEGVKDEVARVFTFNNAGTRIDAPFMISAFC